jgi:hypothetical protein
MMIKRRAKVPRIFQLSACQLFSVLFLACATNGYAQNPVVRVIQPDTIPVPVKQVQGGSGTADTILTLTTAATGTNWTALSSQACTSVLILNDTGTKLSARIGGAGNAMPIPDGSGLKLSVAANANEVSIRRADTSNTQVTVAAAAGK